MSSIFFGCNLRNGMVFQNQRRPNKKEWKDDRGSETSGHFLQWDWKEFLRDSKWRRNWLHFANRRWERRCKTMTSLPDVLSYCWILLTVMFCFGGCISWHVLTDDWYSFNVYVSCPGLTCARSRSSLAVTISVLRYLVAYAGTLGGKSRKKP